VTGDGRRTFVTTSSERRRNFVAWVALAATAGFIALGAVYWDDAWHTDRGRDNFFVPPHVALYGGVAVLGILVLWRWSQTRRDATAGDATLAWLGLLGVVSTFASAPVDEAWHRLFGRDAVIWSPPHLLGIAATFAVAIAGVVAEQRGPAALRVAANALVLGAGMVLVMEFEADVPQFSPQFYLPVACLVIAFVAPLIRTVDRRPDAFSRAVALYTAARIGIVIALAGLGFSTPIVPPLLLVALVLDRLDRTPRRHLIVFGVVLPVVMHLVYLPWLAVVPHGVDLTTGEATMSLLVSMLLANIAIVWSRVRRTAVLAVGAILAVALSASSALAHDPGQGTEDAAIVLTARTQDERAVLDATILDADCAEFTVSALVARRAGEERRIALDELAPCRATGSITLPRRGRWFLYVEYVRSGRHLEAWISVESPRSTVRAVRRLYAGPANRGSAWEGIAGIALLMAAAVLVIRARHVVETRAGAASGT